MRTVIVLTAALACAACGRTEGSAEPTVTKSSASPTPSLRTGQPVARFGGFSARLYARGDNWLCGQGAATSDRCLISNQDTTVVLPDGRTEVRTSEPRPDPLIDCFYVLPFPTIVSEDAIRTQTTETEDTVIFQEAARLREQCRVYAPVYRLASPAGGGGAADVADAFRHYMARWNRGRHLVLFGHGEGGDHLTKLLRDEFDGDAELRGLLLSAVLVGSHTDTAAGSRTGGQLQNIPTCSSTSERSCIVAWSTTGPGTSRAAAARWGEAPPGRARVCTNPAALGGGPAKLTTIVETQPGWLRTPKDITTPFVELPDVLTAECVTSGQTTTLVVRPTVDNPMLDVRDGSALTRTDGGSDLHDTEVPLAMGSIMRLIEAQVTTLG